MPALHAPTAVLTLTHMNPELNPVYPWHWDLGLILGKDLAFLPRLRIADTALARVPKPTKRCTWFKIVLNFWLNS
jgi:hypothetical protein